MRCVGALARWPTPGHQRRSVRHPPSVAATGPARGYDASLLCDCRQSEASGSNSGTEPTRPLTALTGHPTDESHTAADRAAGGEGGQPSPAAPVSRKPLARNDASVGGNSGGSPSHSIRCAALRRVAPRGRKFRFDRFSRRGDRPPAAARTHTNPPEAWLLPSSMQQRMKTSKRDIPTRVNDARKEDGTDEDKSCTC